NDLVTITRKNHNYTTIKDYDIPSELQKTNDDKQFLFFDSGMNDENRVIIFTTDSNLVHLENSQILICDGTFKSAPSSFEQIFTLQCKLRDMFLPMMFCFMKHKNESSYNAIFNWIKVKNNNILLASKSIILDFEIASYNSICKMFTNSKLYGCSFHLGQIVWRKIQKLNFSIELINNVQIKLQVKMILALSFVSTENVLAYAGTLKSYLIQEESEDVLQLYNWFEKEYLKNTIGNKQIEFWNVKDRTERNIPRTTNSIEGFHRHLNTFINVKQPSIHLILNELKNEQTVTDNKLIYSLYKDREPKADPVKK
ncbi:hypothetical protein DMUE_6119, partial [Dictyocoela muelleri]